VTVSAGVHVLTSVTMNDTSSISLATDSTLNGLTLNSLGNLVVNAPGGATAFTNCQIGTTVTVNATVSSSFFETQFLDSGAGGGAGLLLQGAVTYAFHASEIYSAGALVTIDGAGGTVSINRSRVLLSDIQRDAANVSDLTISDSEILGNNGTAAGGSTIAQGATGGDLLIENSHLAAANVTHNGAGALLVENSDMSGNGGGGITTDVASLRDLTINNCDLRAATINYTRTSAASGTDLIRFSTIASSTLTWSGAVDPGGNQNVTSVSLTTGSALTLTDTAGGAAVQQVVVESGSLLTVNAGGDISNSRLAAGFQLTTGAFSHNQVDVSGGFVVVLTAANTNTYKGFGADTLV
jgi:hypothetical protein